MTTSKDKTADQLVASIRKTKADAAGTDKPAATPASKPASSAKSLPRRATTRKAAPKRKASPASRAKKKAAPTLGNGFQSKGRVWPD